jgi:hypothetical protein
MYEAHAYAGAAELLYGCSQLICKVRVNRPSTVCATITVTCSILQTDGLYGFAAGPPSCHNGGHTLRSSLMGINASENTGPATKMVSIHRADCKTWQCCWIATCLAGQRWLYILDISQHK